MRTGETAHLVERKPNWKGEKRQCLCYILHVLINKEHMRNKNEEELLAAEVTMMKYEACG
jgi:hypothetical protein